MVIVIEHKQCYDTSCSIHFIVHSTQPVSKKVYLYVCASNQSGSSKDSPLLLVLFYCTLKSQMNEASTATIHIILQLLGVVDTLHHTHEVR